MLNFKHKLLALQLPQWAKKEEVQVMTGFFYKELLEMQAKLPAK